MESIYARAAELGWTVERVTWLDVYVTPGEVAARVARRLVAQEAA